MKEDKDNMKRDYKKAWDIMTFFKRWDVLDAFEDAPSPSMKGKRGKGELPSWLQPETIKTFLLVMFLVILVCVVCYFYFREKPQTPPIEMFLMAQQRGPDPYGRYNTLQGVPPPPTVYTTPFAPTSLPVSAPPSAPTTHTDIASILANPAFRSVA